jgi:predicted dehydrogenase
VPLSIGILGAAGIAPAAVIRPAHRRDDGTAVVAVASRRGRPEAYAREHGIATAHESYEALLADPAVDLVYNALPPSAHAEWTIAALEAGKDVLCEKPFTMSAAEAEQVVAAADRTGHRVIEAFHDFYHPLQAAVRDLVGSGRLGAVRRASAVFDGANPYSPDSIRHVPALGGGALMDLGCYPVHWLRSLFGEPQVRSASFVPNPLGVDLSITAALEFGSGVVATLESSMADDVTLRSDLEIEGDDGLLVVRNLVFPSQGHSIRLEQDGLSREWTVAGETTYDHQLAAVVAGWWS